MHVPCGPEADNLEVGGSGMLFGRVVWASDAHWLFDSWEEGTKDISSARGNFQNFC